MNFFKKFLRAKPLIEGERKEIRRGTHLRHALSVLFSELVLFICDYHALTLRESPEDDNFPRVEMIRVMDDCYVTSRDPARIAEVWSRFKNILEVTGLTPNLSKCGTQEVRFKPDPEHPMIKLFHERTAENQKKDPLPAHIYNEEDVAKLPEGKVKWGFLEFGEEGYWKVNDDMLEIFCQGLAAQIRATPSVSFIRIRRKVVENFR